MQSTYKKGGIKMNVGEKLKKLRYSADKTLKEISEIAGVSLNTIYRWEHNHSTPRKAALKKVADFYGLPLEAILQQYPSDGSAFGYDSDYFSEELLSGVQDVDQELLEMIKSLSTADKYKALGYIERLRLESLDKLRKL